MDGVLLFHPDTPHHPGALETALEKALTRGRNSIRVFDAGWALALRRGEHATRC